MKNFGCLFCLSECTLSFIWRCCSKSNVVFFFFLHHPFWIKEWFRQIAKVKFWFVFASHQILLPECSWAVSQPLAALVLPGKTLPLLFMPLVPSQLQYQPNRPLIKPHAARLCLLSRQSGRLLQTPQNRVCLTFTRHTHTLTLPIRG